MRALESSGSRGSWLAARVMRTGRTIETTSRYLRSMATRSPPVMFLMTWTARLPSLPARWISEVVSSCLPTREATPNWLAMDCRLPPKLFSLPTRAARSLQVGGLAGACRAQQEQQLLELVGVGQAVAGPLLRQVDLVVVHEHVAEVLVGDRAPGFGVERERQAAGREPVRCVRHEADLAADPGGHVEKAVPEGDDLAGVGPVRVVEPERGLQLAEGASVGPGLGQQVGDEAAGDVEPLSGQPLAGLAVHLLVGDLRIPRPRVLPPGQPAWWTRMPSFLASSSKSAMNARDRASMSFG